MKIPLTSPRLNIKKNHKQILKAITKVVDSDSYILGKEVNKFESKFSRFIGTKYAIGVANGSDAIELSLRAIGIKAGDEVITVSHTAIGTVFAIEAIGAKPVFVDIEEQYFTIDPTKVKKAINKKTKAIIAVHLYGNSADILNLKKLCRSKKIYLIEDVSQAHGAMYGKKKLGSIGDLGCFSCYPTKNLGAIGDGGIITTNKLNLASKIKKLREYGWKNRNSIFYGRNSRLDEIQAAILSVQLNSLEKDNFKRIKAAKFYYNNIKNSNITLPKTRVGSKSVFHLYVIKTNIRDKIIKKLKQNNVVTGIHYPIPVHKQSFYKNRKSNIKNLKITEKISKQIVSLPMYPEIKLEQLKKICYLLNSLS
jgi:dTDP-4-amino-4,6-dideoxygalactose transaminase